MEKQEHGRKARSYNPWWPILNAGPGYDVEERVLIYLQIYGGKDRYRDI